LGSEFGKKKKKKDVTSTSKKKGKKGRLIAKVKENTVQA